MREQEGEVLGVLERNMDTILMGDEEDRQHRGISDLAERRCFVFL